MKRNEKNMAFDFVHPSKLGIVHVHSEAKKVVSSLIQKTRLTFSNRSGLIAYCRQLKVCFELFSELFHFVSFVLFLHVRCTVI